MENRASYLLLLVIICLLLLNCPSLRQKRTQASCDGDKKFDDTLDSTRIAAFVQNMVNRAGSTSNMENPDNLVEKRESIPRKSAVERFRKEPTFALNMLTEELTKEEKRVEVIKDELAMMRKVLPEMTNPVGRKKRGAVTRLDDQKTPLCPLTSPALLGALVVDQSETTMDKVEKDLTWVAIGGVWSPSTCKHDQTVAFILPFRAREDHLVLWLRHMHPILARQQLAYQVFLVEQADHWPFNRAALMNVGVVEAKRLGNFSCFVFHDVDMLPEDDRALYKCPKEKALHMAVAVSRWKYRLAYERYCGGVVALSSDLVDKINGFANSFYGWFIRQ